MASLAIGFDMRHESCYVAADTSIQVFYAGQADGQVYPPTLDEADSGGFAGLLPVLQAGSGPEVSLPVTVWGPDFANHDSSTANLVNPWLPVSQTTMGTGTSADPWWVQTTVQRLAPHAYIADQRVRYINGDDCFRVSYTIAEPEIGNRVHITFFHAADLHVDGDEDGWGYRNASTGAVGAWNQPKDFLEYLVPVTEMGLPPANHYQEASYQTIWDRMGSLAGPGAGFNDTIRTDLHDSGCGLQWDLMLPGVPPQGNLVELLPWTGASCRRRSQNSRRSRGV